MPSSMLDSLLLDYTRGFAFDESLQEELSHDQMVAFSETLLGWAQDGRMTPERSAWLVGFSEGLAAEAEQLGLDWCPPEPQKLSPIGFIGRFVNGDRVDPSQLPDRA